MRQLVREQLQASGGLGGIRALGEEDVLADGERAGVHCTRRVGRDRVGMDSHAIERDAELDLPPQTAPRRPRCPAARSASACRAMWPGAHRGVARRSYRRTHGTSGHLPVALRDRFPSRGPTFQVVMIRRAAWSRSDDLPHQPPANSGDANHVRRRTSVRGPVPRRNDAASPSRQRPACAIGDYRDPIERASVARRTLDSYGVSTAARRSSCRHPQPRR